jgi:hypothetical protein
MLLMRELPHEEREQTGDAREGDQLPNGLESVSHDFSAAST